jgi:hypothetical protein
MTQAFNLSQLANKVNTSGQIDVSTAATGTLLPANGGTGLSSVGTSGNVLTSNGSSWVSQALPAGGVTSLNGQTGAITDTNLYSIGSYITGRPANATNYALDSTIAGSSLFNGINGCYWSGSSFVQMANGGTISLSLINTGTWRCVSPALSGPFGWAFLGIWVRIS